MKSMGADLYIEDLRRKTLRGLEGRAHAGFATGNVAYGYITVPVKNLNLVGAGELAVELVQRVAGRAELRVDRRTGYRGRPAR